MHIRYTLFLAEPNKLFLTYQQPSNNKHSLTNMHHSTTKEKNQRNIQKNFQMFPPNYLQGQSKMDVKYQTMWNFFNKTLSTLFHFPTRKIGNFNFHSPYSYFVFFSNMGYHSHYLSKPPAAAINSRGPQKTHTTPLKYTANSVCHLLGSWAFFSVTFCF